MVTLLPALPAYMSYSPMYPSGIFYCGNFGNGGQTAFGKTTAERTGNDEHETRHHLYVHGRGARAGDLLFASYHSDFRERLRCDCRDTRHLACGPHHRGFFRPTEERATDSGFAGRTR